MRNRMYRYLICMKLKMTLIMAMSIMMLNGALLVEGAKMANDTFKGVGWSTAFLNGWILERRLVQFSTNISLMKRITRFTFGLLSYYIVSLIFVPVMKDWIPGAPGTFVSCYLQIFYVSFIFPWMFKHLEKA